MQGSSDPNLELLDAGALVGHLVDDRSVYGFLAEHRRRLFPDDMFADLPLFDRLRAGYQGPFVMAQDFTVINVTPEQIVTRMVAFEPGPLPVPPSAEYVEGKGGVHPSPDKVRASMPDWLAETIISVPMIEEFKEELKAKGLL